MPTTREARNQLCKGMAIRHVQGLACYTKPRADKGKKMKLLRFGAKSWCHTYHV